MNNKQLVALIEDAVARPPRRKAPPEAIVNWGGSSAVYLNLYEDGTIYFGSTKWLRRRWGQHRKAKKMFILCIGTEDYVREMEKRYIAAFGQSPKCRNRVGGGVGSGGSSNARKVTAFGKTYPSITAAAKAHGISQPLVSYRMNRKKMTLEQALTTPLQQGVKF